MSSEERRRNGIAKEQTKKWKKVEKETLTFQSVSVFWSERKILSQQNLAELIINDENFLSLHVNQV